MTTRARIAPCTVAVAVALGWAALPDPLAAQGEMPSQVAPVAGQAPPPADATAVEPLGGPAEEQLDPTMEAELAAILAEPAPELNMASDRPSLTLYGFGDFTLSKAFPKQRLGVFPPKGVMMTVGNVNLYAAANLTHGFSSLLEVRFGFFPNGSFDLDSLQPVVTNFYDYADWNRPNQWGGIVLERFHLDYSYHGLLNLRVGLWLTPYGIWNVDHGSPTIIPINKPYAVGEQLFPTRQTGFQLFGSGLVGDTTLGYTLTLSNGRGDIQQLDIDRNKALGGRLYLSRSNIGTFTIGVSGYTGLASREQRYSVIPGNPPIINSISDDSFRELALAADLLWEWRELRIQSEFICAQRVYRDGSRKLASGFGTRSGFIPDHFARGGYLLLAYRLPFWSIMPYTVMDMFDRGYARGQLLVFGGNTVNVFAVTGGVNVRPIPSLALKLQYSHIAFPGASRRSRIPNLSLSAAWAF